MRKGRPTITIETDTGSIPDYTSGSLKIAKKTIWLPVCPETGKITAVARGKPLPALKVRALGNGRMELTNASDFSADRLKGCEVFINDLPLAEGSSRTKQMSCTATIKTVFYEGGSETTHLCSFVNRARSAKK
jgi:hypothetical protein